MEVITPEAFSEMCRACLSTTECMKDIFKEKCSNDSRLADVLMECSSIQISLTDGLPSVICNGCTHHLEAFVRFKKSCAESKKILEQYRDEMADRFVFKDEPIDIVDNPIEIDYIEKRNTADNIQIVHLNPSHDESKNDPENKYQCNYCSQSFKFKTTFHVHQKIHTGKQSFKCDVCDKSFMMERMFKRHLKIHAEESPRAETDDLIVFKNEPLDIVDNPIETEIKLEVDSDENVADTDETPQTYLHMSLEEENKNKPEKRFLCDICQMSFKVKKIFDVHLKIHAGKWPYKCKLCAKSFTSKGSFDGHMRIHTGEKPFACNICDKTFRQKKNLRSHLKIHTGVKSYECETCGKLFRHKHVLNTHRSTHMEVKPFACNVCDKTFALNEFLRDHMRIHTGEKPYKCEICGHSYRQKRSLTEHKNIHSKLRFPCDICQKTFKHKKTLKSHLILHTGDHFRCEICEKSFSRKQVLNSHMATHLREDKIWRV